jgi:hypothetical protein
MENLSVPIPEQQMWAFALYGDIRCDLVFCVAFLIT